MKFPGVNQNKAFTLPQKFKSEQQIDLINHIQNLPESWVTELANIFEYHSSQRESINWEAQLRRHLNDQQACYYFKIIYGRLTGQLDERFSPITDTDKQSCIYLLEQGFDACTPGVKERAQMYISILQKPIQLDELLCEYRTAIVKTAAHHSRFSQNIHYHTTLLSRAKKRFGINYQLDSTPYNNRSNSEVDEQLRNIIEPKYQMHHLVDGIIQVIEDSIFRVDPHLNYDNGDSCYPVYSNQIHGRYSEYLNAIIENSVRYETLAYEADEHGLPRAMTGINWTDIRKRLWELLQQKGYLDKPEPDYRKLANNNPDELTKAIYYFLALAKNDPEQLPQYCSQLDRYQCLEKVAHQAFWHVIDTEIANLHTLINNIKLHMPNGNQTQNNSHRITEIFDEDYTLANVTSEYIPKLLKAYYKFLGENDFKEWLMADDCQKLRQLLSNNAQHTHQALYEYFDAQTIATLLTQLQRAMPIEHVGNDDTIWHIAAQYHDARVIDKLLQKTSEIDRLPNVIDSDGQTPLHHALEYQNVEVANQLLSTTWYNDDFFRRNLSRFSSGTPLHTAIRSKCRIDTTKRLIDYPSLICTQDGHGEIPLETAISHDNCQAAKSIIKKQPHDQNNIVLSVLKKGGDNCYQLLYWAIQQNIWPMFDSILYEHNRQPNSRNTALKQIDWTHVYSDGNQLIHYAVNSVLSKQNISFLLNKTGNKANYLQAKDSNGKTALHIATSQYKLPIAQQLIYAGANVNEKDNNGNTPLHDVADSTHLLGNTNLDILCEAGANVKAQNHDGETPLHIAAKKRQDNKLYKLLDKNADPDITDYGHRTPLHYLAAYPNITDLGYRTPLDYSAAYPNLEAIQTPQTPIERLLQHSNASIGWETSQPLMISHFRQPELELSAGESALSIALKTQNTENARLLIEQGAPLSTSKHSTTYMLDLALKLSSDLAMEAILPRITYNDYKELFTKQYANHFLFLVYAIQHGKTDVFDNILHDSSVLNAIDWTKQKFIHEGNTLAHEAVKSQHDQAYAIVLRLDEISKNRRLTNFKMSIFKYCNVFNESPLHMLAFNHSQQAPQILQAFLDGTIANTKFDIHQKDENGNTLVDHAIYQGNRGIMEYILNHEPDSRLNYQSLLSQAIQYNQPEIVDVLIDHGAQINEPIPPNNHSPLSQAISGNKKDAADKLIQRGADISVKKAYNDTMLNYAIRRGYREIAKSLLNAPNIASIINEPTDYGKTPLHTAIEYQDIALVTELINHGNIDLNRPDKAGYTPLHYATLMDNTAIVEQLLDCDAIEINKTTNRFRETAAFQACREGLPSIVECFKNRAPEALNYTDHNGLTALHYCCLPPHILEQEQTHKYTIIDKLIRHGLNVNAQEGLGRTPLDIAESHEGEHHLINDLKQHRSTTNPNAAAGAASSSNPATFFQDYSHLRSSNGINGLNEEPFRP